MWNLELNGYSFYYIFYYFFTYSFLGWIYESCYVSIHKKKWVNRGFLNGPIIPLYGFAAVLVYVTFWQYQKEYVLIFFGGMILTTILEYITSLFMELIFQAKWWDYSKEKLNINGRVCLKASLLWGTLCVCLIGFLQPIVDTLIHFIPRRMAEYFGYVIVSFFLADGIVTVVHTLQLDSMLIELQKLKRDIIEYLDSTKLYEAKEEWKNKWSFNKLPEFADHIKELIDENKERLIDNNKNREGFEFKAFRLEIENHVKEFAGKYQRKSNKTSFIQKRLLKAFPNMHSVKRDDALKDLREWLQKHRRDMR